MEADEPNQRRHQTNTGRLGAPAFYVPRPMDDPQGKSNGNQPSLTLLKYFLGSILRGTIGQQRNSIFINNNDIEMFSSRSPQSYYGAHTVTNTGRIALTGSQAESQAPIQGLRKAMADGTRLRRAATEETYWAYSEQRNQYVQFLLWSARYPTLLYSIALDFIASADEVDWFCSRRVVSYDQSQQPSFTFDFGEGNLPLELNEEIAIDTLLYVLCIPEANLHALRHTEATCRVTRHGKNSSHDTFTVIVYAQHKVVVVDSKPLPLLEAVYAKNSFDLGIACTPIAEGEACEIHRLGGWEGDSQIHLGIAKLDSQMGLTVGDVQSEVRWGVYGPDEGWASAYPECRERNQSPINIADQDTKVSTEYQELTLEGFDTESSNKTSMKNNGKTVAIMLKDEYFVRGAGLPGSTKDQPLAMLRFR
ncbi:Receptor-type tyrosine-protein phosphatase gamma [Liparis tanakae]|uniref:Receptor-type tyrosine-protein phosphatase gamma n=1 Tax=Liparis tanakae TaxID=230148 RepID=A0A4Z2JFY5_9TELE|nr:Receptor-type tyrosine-protein phosphatase gamma [Liparis tanakae]